MVWGSFSWLSPWWEFSFRSFPKSVRHRGRLLFLKGQPKAWIRKNKFFGEPVRDWEDHRVLRPKLKIISTVAMVGGAAIGHWKFLPVPALILDAIFLGCIVFVLTRDSKPPRVAHA